MLLDLPPECISIVIEKLKIKNDIWRNEFDVMKDAASLAMTSKKLWKWSDLLFGISKKQPEYPKLPENINEKSTKSQLIEQLKCRNLKISGNKDELLQRLISFHISIENPRFYICPLKSDSQHFLETLNWTTLTVVSKSLLLKPADRSEVRTKKYFNGHSKWGETLYNLVDARKACLIKYGDIESLELERLRLIKNREYKRNLEVKKINSRKTELVQALNSHNCSLRSDSRLCDNYITKGIGNVLRIAEIMSEMKFFHNHTHYRNILSNNIEETLEYEGRFDIDEESHIAKQQALKLWIKVNGGWELVSQLEILPDSLLG